MLRKRTKNLGGSFDFDNWSQKLENLKQESTNPGFWNDNQNAQTVLRKISRIEKNIALWEDLDRRNNDMEILFEFAETGEIQVFELNDELEAYKNIIDDI